ncbi:MAG: hypothetical protein H7301_08955 [Cryobacterium sp.]|nr:hypothetical protein [Oligoflexia bacterium]
MTSLNAAPSPVSESLLLICEKCGKKLETFDGENPAKILQTHLKETISDRFGKGKIRSVLTSCLDVCPKGELTLAIVRVDRSGAPDTFFTFAPGEPKEQTDEILALAQKQTLSHG